MCRSLIKNQMDPRNCQPEDKPLWKQIGVEGTKAWGGLGAQGKDGERETRGLDLVQTPGSLFWASCISWLCRRRSREEGLRCSTMQPFGLPSLTCALGGCGIQGKGLESEYLGSNPVSSFPAI